MFVRGIWVDQSGNVVNGGTVTPYLAGTSTAVDIYAAASGGAAVNSVESNSAGYWVFYLDESTYVNTQLFDITLSKTDFTSKTYPNVQIYPGSFGVGSATKPSVAFGDGDTGFYEEVDDELRVTVAGNKTFNLGVNTFTGAATGAFGLWNWAADTTVPSMSPNRSDANTGIGSAAADQLSLIAGGVEALRLDSGGQLTKVVQAGVTANVGSTQGTGEAITAPIVEISVCANAGDSLTLPTAVAGYDILIINHGANSADIFPNTSDAINEGAANAAKAVAADASMRCVSYDGTNWECLTMAR